MKFIDIVKLAERGYAKDFPESILLDFVDEQGNPKDESGDTLALFIVRELHETFDDEAREEDQIDAAINAMRKARSDLDNVIAALENTDLLSEAGIEPEEEMLLVQYQCPKCGRCWDEEGTSACYSECPACGTENITALSWVCTFRKKPNFCGQLIWPGRQLTLPRR